MNRHRDMVANLRTKVNQMASTLNMSNFANRDSLLGPEIKPADAMRRTEGLDNHGIVGLQWQIMKEQDEGLEKLEETVTSTKHIALAVNEELDLHIRLIDDLDQHVDVIDSRLRANSHYFAIIEQIAEGNMWLNDNIGVVPKNSWAIDPFGYSATMAYLSAVWVSRTCLFRGLIMRFGPEEPRTSAVSSAASESVRASARGEWNNSLCFKVNNK
ncbi:hypothetical protein MANES_09G081612v8 [Manihot esculenta]|nr:hypothetical protein MANES_09G081612v8 [Manihot esculenta]KAG8647503.1 hypothetical protein MANES_09G081612v8 [Manihot esculenta]